MKLISSTTLNYHCRIVFTILLIFGCSTFGMSSPLVFKIAKVVDSAEYVELGVFDASRFKQIRVGVNMISRKTDPKVNERAQVELNAARRELARNQDLLEKGVIARSEYDAAKDRVENANAALNNSGGIGDSQFSIVGVIDNEEVSIDGFSEAIASRSFLIDSPPAIIRFKAKGKGNFSVYVWAQ